MSDTTQPTDWPATLERMLGEAIEAFDHREGHRQERDYFEAAEPPPLRETVYESVGKLLDYEARLLKWQAEKMRLDGAYARACKDVASSVGKLLAVSFPVGVWVRVGDRGVGISHTDQAGYELGYELEVRPWAGRALPSLDHRKRQD